MIQCFVTQSSEPTFNEANSPTLVAASKINADTTMHPRIMHSHANEVEILFVRSGRGIYIVDEVRYPVSKGDLIICNRNVIHDEDPTHSEELNTYCCTISNLRLPGLDDHCLIPPNIKPVIPVGRNYKLLHGLYSLLYSQLSSDQPTNPETSHHIMMSLLTAVLHILEHHSEQLELVTDEQRHLCDLTKAYINTHYKEDITSKSIAKAMNISPSYLAHIFKDIVGYPLMNYTLRRRVGESQTLLINTKKTITEIAVTVGYGNPNYYNVVFTKNVGMSPSAYRKMYSNLA